MCSKRKFCLFLLTALFYAYLFFFPKKAFAATIVINEFMPHPSSGDDWIELYNATSQSIAIDNWKIFDSTSAVVTLTGSIDANGFKVIDVSNRLNNGGDTVTVKDQNDATIDEYIYVSDPGTNYSYGRTIDGTGAWVTFNASTKGSTNNSATPVPTSTPTPSPSLTPTNVPTPTKTPTPTPTSKPTATPTPKPANTATPTPTAKATSINIPTSTLSPTKTTAKITSSSAVLGAKTAKPTKTPTFTPAPSKNVKKIDSTKPIFPQLFMGAGVLCLAGCGILGFRIYQKGKLINNA